MPTHRARRDLLCGRRVLKAGSHVWRVGHVAGPLDYPPAAYLPDPRSGRFDDPLKEYRTLYCARHQSVALLEARAWLESCGPERSLAESPAVVLALDDGASVPCSRAACQRHRLCRHPGALRRAAEAASRAGGAKGSQGEGRRSPEQASRPPGSARGVRARTADRACTALRTLGLRRKGTPIVGVSDGPAPLLDTARESDGA